MSGTLEALQRKLKSGEDLESIVKTMKALAAINVRQYEKAVESLGDYYRTVEMGLSVVLGSQEAVVAERVANSSPVLILVFGSDHGLAGRFNEQIVSYAVEHHWGSEAAGPLPENRIIGCIGEQAYIRLLSARQEVAELFHVPVSMGGITAAVQSLLDRIEQWRAGEAVQRVLLFYNRPLSGAGFTSGAENLLPVDLAALREQRLQWPSRSLPTFTMQPASLLSSLLRQYFFVSLFRAYALSLAAENASRLAAMQAAEKNISERLDELRTAFQQERQAAITEELLDIIAGFKALSGK